MKGIAMNSVAVMKLQEGLIRMTATTIREYCSGWRHPLRQKSLCQKERRRPVPLAAFTYVPAGWSITAPVPLANLPPIVPDTFHEVVREPEHCWSEKSASQTENSNFIPAGKTSDTRRFHRRAVDSASLRSFCSRITDCYVDTFKGTLNSPAAHLQIFQIFLTSDLRVAQLPAPLPGHGKRA